MKKLLLIINRIIYISAAAMLIAGMIFTFIGQPAPVLAVAIWTTTGSCGDPQNINHYNHGDHVFINGAGFSPGDYSWDITGQPGGASCDPDIAVASGVWTVDASGAFCFDAYTIAMDDCGTYQTKFGGVKGDNYRVGDPPTLTPTNTATNTATNTPTNRPIHLPTRRPTHPPTHRPIHRPTHRLVPLWLLLKPQPIRRSRLQQPPTRPSLLILRC